MLPIAHLPVKQQQKHVLAQFNVLYGQKNMKGLSFSQFLERSENNDVDMKAFLVII